MNQELQQAHHFPEVGIPFFWPLRGEPSATCNAEAHMRSLIHEMMGPYPEMATHSSVLYALHSFTLRAFGSQQPETEVPTLIIPPHAGHTSIVADFYRKQSIVETLMRHSVKRLLLVEWHTATKQMKDYDIDDYLAELHVAVMDLGGRVNLIGLCQGGWFASLYAARFPENVTSLVLAGSPIDMHAGESVLHAPLASHSYSFFADLVAQGGGILTAHTMQQGFFSLYPSASITHQYAELYPYVEAPDYTRRTEHFTRWFSYVMDLPGAWYLQVMQCLYKQNQFARGAFEALGKTVDPKSITCPLYLLAGEKDMLTPKEQVFAAKTLFGTPHEKIVQSLASSSHIGLFLSHHVLEHYWSDIAAWLKRMQGDRLSKLPKVYYFTGISNRM